MSTVTINGRTETLPDDPDALLADVLRETGATADANAWTSDSPANTRKPPSDVFPVSGSASTTPTASTPGIDRSLAAISSICRTRRILAPSAASGGKNPCCSMGG